jgi:hypothetical protein
LIFFWFVACAEDQGESLENKSEGALLDEFSRENYWEKVFDQLCQQHIDDDEPCDSAFMPCFVCDGWKSGPVKSTDKNF